MFICLILLIQFIINYWDTANSIYNIDEQNLMDVANPDELESGTASDSKYDHSDYDYKSD